MTKLKLITPPPSKTKCSNILEYAEKIRERVIAEHLALEKLKSEELPLIILMTSNQSNPFTFIISGGNITFSANIVSGKGTSLGSGPSIYTPNNCNYITINAVYQKTEYYDDGKDSYSYTVYGAAVQRVKVNPNTNYYNLNYYTGTNAGYTYKAEYCNYYSHPQLGNILSSNGAIHYVVYWDHGTGNPYSDSTTRNKYRELTGGNLPQ